MKKEIKGSNGDSKSKLEFFQNITLELSNGKKVSASVPAFCLTEDEIKEIVITSVTITKPLPMPKGSHFEIISE